MSFYNLSNGVHVGFSLTFFDSQELEPDVGGGWKAHKNDGWALLPMVVAQPCQSVNQLAFKQIPEVAAPHVSGFWLGGTHPFGGLLARQGRPAGGFSDFNSMYLDLIFGR